MIGIIGAMSIEVEGLLEKMNIDDIVTIGGMVFYTGEIAGKKAVAARCGVGKVHAAMCAQTMITSFPVTAVLNLGVAGAIDNVLNIGDVVISEDLVHHDMTTGTAGGPVGQVPGLDVLAFTADDKLAKSAIYAYNAVFEGSTGKVHHGRIATGDQFIDIAERKQWISENFRALCVEMEGAAIGQVCYLNKIPFVAIRAISDKADGSAEMDFLEFVAQAAENSSKIVVQMMGDIS